MPLLYDDETSLPDDLAKDALGNAASHPRGQLGGQKRLAGRLTGTTKVTL